MRQRRRYDDKFRASAVVMLEAAGYPDKKGALEQVSKSLKTPISTLHGWYYAKHNPPPSDIRTEKRGEIVDIIRSEIYHALAAAPGARPDASYRDLITGAAILVDKLQLLTDKPTEITKDVSLTDEERSNRIAGLLDTARARRDRPATIH